MHGFLKLTADQVLVLNLDCGLMSLVNLLKTEQDYVKAG